MLPHPCIMLHLAHETPCVTRAAHQENKVVRVGAISFAVVASAADQMNKVCWVKIRTGPIPRWSQCCKMPPGLDYYRGRNKLTNIKFPYGSFIDILQSPLKPCSSLCGPFFRG